MSRYLICTNVLGNAARLTRDDVRPSDIIKERSLAMINMPHNCYHRRTTHQFFRRVLLLFQGGLFFSCFNIKAYLITELICYKRNCVLVEPLVNRNHDSQFHALLYDVRNIHTHKVRQVIYRQVFSNPKLPFLFLRFLLKSELLFFSLPTLPLSESSSTTYRCVVHCCERPANGVFYFGLIDLLMA